MSAYNKVNGAYPGECSYLNQEILKNEWGHEGLVITDWGANNDRIAGLRHGLELEMPFSGKSAAQEIVAAVKKGVLAENILNARVRRVVELIIKGNDTLGRQQQSLLSPKQLQTSLPKQQLCKQLFKQTTAPKQHSFKPPPPKYDAEAHHQFARKAAQESMVLLQNHDNILPLDTGKRVALIGAFAKTPRYQGSGSSLVNPHTISTAYETFKKRLPDRFLFAPGYCITDEQTDEQLLKEAVAVARQAEAVVVMVGLTDIYESEGFDRAHLDLPPGHNALVEAVARVNSNVIVTLSNGAPVRMPWQNSVKAILEQYLAGQAGGQALADIIFGDINPSGKLAETFPRALDEIPAHQNFPGRHKQVQYREGLYVGYRAYDTLQITPLFPFGHGLSYTTFSYNDLAAETNCWGLEDIEDAEEIINVSVGITNTGRRAGQEVVQVYLQKPDSIVYRPEKELKAFKKVSLKPGERKNLTLSIPLAECGIYQKGRFVLETGTYRLLVGASSRDIRGEVPITISSEDTVEPDNLETYSKTRCCQRGQQGRQPGAFNPSRADFEKLLGYSIPEPAPTKPYTMNSVMAEISETFIGRKLLRAVQKQTAALAAAGDEKTRRMLEQVALELPFRSLISFSSGKLSKRRARGLLDLMNKRYITGAVRVLRG